MYIIHLRMAKSMVAMKLVHGHLQAATNAIHKDQSLRATCSGFEHSRKLIEIYGVGKGRLKIRTLLIMLASVDKR